MCLTTICRSPERTQTPSRISFVRVIVGPFSYGTQKPAFWPFSTQMAANFCRFVFKNWARYALCQMDVFSNFSSIFRDREMWYLLTKRLLAVLNRLPLGEASVYRRVGWREGKESAGGRWEGEREATRFLFFDKSHNALLLFSIIAIFTGIPSRSNCRGERFYQYSNFVLSSTLLFSSIRAADWLEQTFSECIW